MDWFRGFLGLGRGTGIDPGRGNKNDQPFNNKEKDENREISSILGVDPFFPNDDNRGRCPTTPTPFGFSLNNSEMINEIEVMFNEMEHQLESFFHDTRGVGKDLFGFGTLGPVQGGFTEDLPSLPPPPLGKNRDENVRSLVLKEPETGSRINRLPEVADDSKKVDKDLDDLFKKSILPLSEIPEAPRTDTHSNYRTENSQILDVPGSYTSRFQSVYSTHSFINGQWEGKTVREDEKGKEIITYTKDANGETIETTEFIPNTGSTLSDQNSKLMMDGNSQLLNPFKFFEQFFKPRL